MKSKLLPVLGVLAALALTPPAGAFDGLFRSARCAEQLRDIEQERNAVYRRRAREKNLNETEVEEFVRRNVRRRFLLGRSDRINTDYEIGIYMLGRLVALPEWTAGVPQGRILAAERLAAGMAIVSGIEAPLTQALLALPPRNDDDIARAGNLLHLAACAALYHVEASVVFGTKLPFDRTLAELEPELVRRAVQKAAFSRRIVGLEATLDVAPRPLPWSRDERQAFIDGKSLPEAVRELLAVHLDFDRKYDVLPHSFHTRFLSEARAYFDRSDSAP